MKILVAIIAAMFLTLTIACGGGEEELNSADPSEPTTTVIEEEPTSTPSPMASSISATPIPTEAPTPVPTETTSIETGDREATEQDIQDSMAIYETVKPLPATDRFYVDYNPGGGGNPGGVFQVWIITPMTNEEYKQIILEVQEWFRERDYEPCESPMDLTTKYMLKTPPAGESLTYEPCNDHDS